MPQGVARVPEAWEWARTKRCPKCGETKPWAKFSPGAYWEDGTVRFVQAYCHPCHAEINRNRPKKPLAPERLAYLIEYKRRKRAQIAAERTSGGRRLPSGPITAVINRAVEEEGEIALVAEQCRVQERILRRVMAQEHVTLRLADEICTRLGVRLYDAYPELEEVAA